MFIMEIQLCYIVVGFLLIWSRMYLDIQVVDLNVFANKTPQNG